jgi:broad specificity phosphatase PhoE
MVSSSSSRGLPYQPVHVYPSSVDFGELQQLQEYATWKRLHVVRHAEGTHNVNQDYKDMSKHGIDARLTDKGKEQCHRLASSSSTCPTMSQVLKGTELVVTSPLTRCLQTALLSFPTLTENPRIPFVALESIRETVNYACDRRRPISELLSLESSSSTCLEMDANRVNFEEIQHDHDHLWDSYEQRLGSSSSSQARESAELHRVADRARDFFTWIRDRSEQEMIVCTHSAFLRVLHSWGQPGGVPWIMPQLLDHRHPKPDQEIPVVQYCGGDDDDDAALLETYLRRDYDNCELRSFVVAFPN